MSELTAVINGSKLGTNEFASLTHRQGYNPAITQQAPQIAVQVNRQSQKITKNNLAHEKQIPTEEVELSSF